MRVHDRPLPTVVLDDAEMLADWPVRPVIAVESLDQWDDPAILWDDSAVIWDGGWRDATCAWTGLEIDTGEPDEAGLFPASRCVVQLDNADGAWSTLRVDGGVSRFGPGTILSVWAHNDEDDWWLFSGRIARWDQRADNTIEVEAFDSFSDLAEPIGTYTPGVAAQKLGARLTAVLAASGEAIPTRFAIGTVTMTAQETDRSPLEEMQTVALSDGGLVFVDADGTLVALDRTWPSGRDDQTTVPVLSDNVCTSPIIVWDAILSVNDDSLADRVVLENVTTPMLRATAGTASGYTLAFTEQQWTTQIEGDNLALFLQAQQAPRRLSIEEFALYLNDPKQPDIWRAVDWRRVDHLRFVHDSTAVGGTLRVDVITVLDSILHEVTPDGWTMTVSTAKTRAVAEPPPLYNDNNRYDDTPPEEYGF